MIVLRLNTLVTLVLLVVLASGCGSPRSIPIVDTHIHLYDTTRPQGVPWPPESDSVLYRPVLPPDYAKICEENGISATVIVEASNRLSDNQWVLDLAADEPFIVGLVGRIDPCTDDFAAHVARFADHPLFQGVRFRGKPYFDDIDRGSFMKDMETLDFAAGRVYQKRTGASCGCLCDTRKEYSLHRRGF